jgi:hypothetical protein
MDEQQWRRWQWQRGTEEQQRQGQRAQQPEKGEGECAVHIVSSLCVASFFCSFVFRVCVLRSALRLRLRQGRQRQWHRDGN